MPHTRDPNWHPSAKSRRCYHRVISGIERGGTLRFLTLTSSKNSPDTCQRSFRALYMRLKRRGLIQGYIKVPEASKNGKQHLHILFRGSYLEQALISHWWQEIHHAKIIDIRRVWANTNKRKLASDMASYMAKDNWYRYSWNWGWVWRGFCRDWAKLKKQFWEYQKVGGQKPFSWLLQQWSYWLKYDLMPYWGPVPQPP